MEHAHLDLVFAAHVSTSTVLITLVLYLIVIMIYSIVSLGCGESASENNTYMVQAATTSFTTNPCVIKLCPVSSSICRIRYDLSTFVLASQTTATNAAEATAAPCKFIIHLFLLIIIL